MKSKLVMTIEQMKDEAKWLEMRTKGIGGSDAAIVCGLNKWKSPHALWLEKTGQVEPEDLSDNEYVYWGHKLEQLVADRFCELTGKKVRKCGLMQSIEHPFMLASVDRLVVGENAGLECKTANGFSGKQWEADEIPDAYYIQALHYMAVTGFDKWYIAVLIGGNRFVWKEIPRNDEEIAALIEAENVFWFMVENNIEPPVDGTASCSESLLKKYPGGKKEPVQLPETVENKAAKFLELKEMERGLKIDLAQLSNEIKEMMGNNEEAYCGNYQFRWNTVKGRTGIDKDKLKQLYPTQYAECLKMGATSRSFSVKYVE